MTALGASCDPDRFYEAAYGSQLKVLAAAMIDAEGPITFKRLCDRIARAHGFQRTGRQIRSTVWAACRRLRTNVATPDGHKVFWPNGVPPQDLTSYRGLGIEGERREWREVPFPEKLWLVQKILERRSNDPIRTLAEEIGVTRVTTQFRIEIEKLIRHLDRG